MVQACTAGWASLGNTDPFFALARACVPSAANCSDFLLNFRDGYMEDDDGAKYHKMLVSQGAQHHRSLSP